MSNDSTQNFIGIEITATQVGAVLISTGGEQLVSRDAALPNLERATIVAQITKLVDDLVSSSKELLNIDLGIAVPAMVDVNNQKIVLSFEIPSLINATAGTTNTIGADNPSSADFYRELKESTGRGIVFINDANAAGYAEFRLGAGVGCRNLFYAMLGTGVGGALILDGKLWRGASGLAGEFGNITINPEGIESVQGTHGTLEIVASAPNIVRRTHERLFRDNTSSLSKLAMSQNFTIADVVREARGGDDFALMMLERTGKSIGIGVADLISLLNIELIIFGGSVMTAGDLLLDPIIREAGSRSLQPQFQATRILAAKLGAEAARIGAALLVRDLDQQLK